MKYMIINSLQYGQLPIMFIGNWIILLNFFLLIYFLILYNFTFSISNYFLTLIGVKKKKKKKKYQYIYII